MIQLRAGRAEAAAVIWTWQEGPTLATSPRPAGRARLRGLLQGLVGGAAGAALFFFVSDRLGLVVMTIATIITTAALVSPLGLFAAIEHGFAALGRWIGHALTWLLLPLVFFLFFVPFRALFRRGRRDSMKRFFDTEATSYWSPRKDQPAAPDSDRRRRYRP